MNNPRVTQLITPYSSTGEWKAVGDCANVSISASRPSGYVRVAA
jgi:hypothetical protein